MTIPLRVLSAGVMRRIVGEVAAEFHRETGCPVELTVGHRRRAEGDGRLGRARGTSSS
jgi:hypothetical protein